MSGQFTKAADIFSLGITILEIACDLDLPSGGDSWHQLRDGQIPEHLFSGIKYLRFSMNQKNDSFVLVSDRNEQRFESNNKRYDDSRL